MEHQRRISDNNDTKKKPIIVKTGGTYNFYQDRIEVLDRLESGKTYVMKEGPYHSLYLADGPDLELPSRLYDFEKPFRDQVLATLSNKDAKNNVGVALEGYKGQGKSVVAKQLAIEANLPIIIIDSPVNRNCDIVGFLNSLCLDHTLFIDEFEKIFLATAPNGEYGYHTQDIFLSLLDGTYTSKYKRLFLVTSNTEIGDKFINRPSRVRYYKKYNFLKKEVFHAIVDDLLVDQSMRQDLEDCINIPSCTIDLITTIVEEMNIHKKKYSEFREFFNHKEKEITYTKYLQKDDGSWEMIEDIKSTREIGPEGEYFHSLPGMYNAKIISNDGDTVIYKSSRWVRTEEGEYNEDAEEKGKYVQTIYKLKKWSFTVGDREESAVTKVM